jgi:hypothetical protein
VPVYRGIVRKLHEASGKRFSNTYLISQPNALEALDVLNVIQAAEKAVTYNSIRFFENRVTNRADKLDGRSFDPNELGSRDDEFASGELPLFCTVRVVFSDAAGKPEQKYLRLGATETDLTLGLWDAAFTGTILASYANVLLAQTSYIGPGGEHPVAARVLRAVQNRQLGWHRRSRPGQKRGWVAA